MESGTACLGRLDLSGNEAAVAWPAVTRAPRGTRWLRHSPPRALKKHCKPNSVLNATVNRISRPRTARSSENSRECGLSDVSTTSNPALQQWAEHALAWSDGADPSDLPHADVWPAAGALPRDPRDEFVFFINGAKENAPAAAMALLKRLGDAS